jgi:hypothetical protein
MIERQFEKMGADLRLINIPRPIEPSAADRRRFGSFARDRRPLSVNVEQGEFIITKDADVKVRVVDVAPKGRHLLLMSEIDGAKEKFLCGHDERDWFVAAVPGRPSNIVQAMELLKPPAAREAQNRKGVRKKNRNKRKNKGFVRQGEWFFLPAPDLKPDKIRIVGPEPITRDRNSKPHMVQFCYRTGGETVYVHRKHAPQGIGQAAYSKLQQKINKNKGDYTFADLGGWSQMVRNATVYAKGTVRHADHATIHLDGWHEVLMNRENEAPAMRHVTFLD